MTKPALFSQDDRILEGAGRQATAEVNRFFSRDKLELDERMRLARELHDGVLQSLAGAALQLEAISRLIDIDPKAAQEHLRAVDRFQGHRAASHHLSGQHHPGMQPGGHDE